MRETIDIEQMPITTLIKSKYFKPKIFHILMKLMNNNKYLFQLEYTSKGPDYEISALVQKLKKEKFINYNGDRFEINNEGIKLFKNLKK